MLSADPASAAEPPTCARIGAVHVIAGLDPIYGGPSYSVPRLCQALAKAGAEPILLSVANAPHVAHEGGYSDRRFAHNYAGLPIVRGLRISSGLSNALSEAASDGDLVHNHGLWLMPNVQAGWAARRAQKPLVVSPRGMLSPVALQFSRTKKHVFWQLVQGPAVRHAACLHVTSVQEHEEIRSFGLSHPVAVIPNGMDLPEGAAVFDQTRDERIVLSLGRIHPKKGLDYLLRAWAIVEARYPEWRLRIAGADESGYAGELRALARRLALSHVTIEEPIYGDSKWDAYRGADLFVLPSLNENFGLTVAEALAAGIPVISTKGTPWRQLETEGCGWWIDHGVEPQAAVLDTAMAMPRASLRRMGAKGRAWIERDFSWDVAARGMLDVYRWCIGLAEAPDSVRFK